MEKETNTVDLMHLEHFEHMSLRLQFPFFGSGASSSSLSSFRTAPFIITLAHFFQSFKRLLKRLERHDLEN